jgi:hypothetical protein
LFLEAAVRDKTDRRVLLADFVPAVIRAIRASLDTLRRLSGEGPSSESEFESVSVSGTTGRLDSN